MEMFVITLVALEMTSILPLTKRWFRLRIDWGFFRHSGVKQLYGNSVRLFAWSVDFQSCHGRSESDSSFPWCHLDSQPISQDATQSSTDYWRLDPSLKKRLFLLIFVFHEITSYFVCEHSEFRDRRTFFFQFSTEKSARATFALTGQWVTDEREKERETRDILSRTSKPTLWTVGRRWAWARQRTEDKGQGTGDRGDRGQGRQGTGETGETRDRGDRGQGRQGTGDRRDRGQGRQGTGDRDDQENPFGSQSRESMDTLNSK